MKKDFMISKIISRAACLTELTSNPKSFSNCPDLHGGVPDLPGGSRPMLPQPTCSFTPNRLASRRTGLWERPGSPRRLVVRSSRALRASAPGLFRIWNKLHSGGFRHRE